MKPVLTIHAEVIAALMWGAKTARQVQEMAGCSEGAAYDWLAALRRSGVVRITGQLERKGVGQRERIYELQVTPFALPDWTPEGELALAPPEKTPTSVPARRTPAAPQAAGARDYPGAQASPQPQAQALP